MTWKIASEADSDEVGEMLQGVRLMYALSESLDMPSPEEEIVVYFDNDVERLAAYYADLVGWDIETSREVWATSKAIAGTGSITIKGSSPGASAWDNLTFATAHEFAHAAFQHGLAGLLTGPAAFDGHGGVPVPRWLSEGMAEIMADLAILKQDGSPYPDPNTRKRRVSRAARADVPLRDAETWPSGFVARVASDDESEAKGRAIIDCIYACGYVAVEL